MSTGTPGPLAGPFAGTHHLGVDERVRFWGARRFRSQEHKQLFEAAWRYYWQSYRAHMAPLDDPLSWWRSNEPIPTVYKIVETLLPRYVLGMFQSPDWFTVEARNARSEGYEEMCQQLLRTTVEEMRVFPKMYEAIKYALIMGHAWGKVVWREDYERRQVLVPTPIPWRTLAQGMGSEWEEAGEAMYGAEMLDSPSPVMGMAQQIIEEEVYNAPDFEWRTLDRIFPDPTGADKWCIEDISTTLEELLETQSELDVYNSRVLAEMRQVMAWRGSSNDAMGLAREGTPHGLDYDYQREPQDTEGIPEEYVSPMRDGIGVRLWQCWGWVSPEHRRYPDSQWRLTVIADGKWVLRDDPSPTPDQRPPYFPIKSIVIPGRLYGESVIRYIGPLADQQTRISNMRLDEVFLGVWQQFAVRKDSIASDVQLMVAPGGIIEIDPRPGEKVGDAFHQLQRSPVLPDAYAEDQYRQTQAEAAAFATEIFQGAAPAPGTTATEVERRLQQGNAPHVLAVTYNEYAVVRELLTRTWKWLQMRLPHERLVRMMGDQLAVVSIADIQTPIDIVVGGGVFAMSKDARVQMDQELLQMAGNPVFAQYIRGDMVLRKWMLDRGWKNPERYAKTQQEVMLEQQMAMAAASGGVGPDGQPVGGAGGEMGAMGAPPSDGMALPPGAPPPPAPTGPYGQSPLPAMPYVPRAGEEAALVGGQLATSGLVNSPF